MKSIAKIRLKGGFYNNLIDIDLSKSDNQRLSVIYGTNGSGKSSISSAIREYKDSLTLDPNKKVYEHVSFLNSVNHELNHSQENKEKMWVYNDEYLDDNIRWNEDYLGSIVMFGEQTQIDDELKEINEQIKKIKDDCSLINIEKYEATKGPYSLKKAKSSVIEILRNNWANRDKNIRGMSRNTSVNDQVIQDIVNEKRPNQTLVQLKSEYEKSYVEYQSIDSNTEKIAKISISDIQSEKEDMLTNLLEFKIAKPEGNELEDKLYKLIESGVDNYVDASYKHFYEHDESECPYCLQILNPAYKHELIGSIKNVLNQDVKNHIFDLELSKIEYLDIDLEYLRSFDNEKVTEILLIQKEYNDIVVGLNNLVDKKIRNVFEPLLVEEKILSDLGNALHKKISALNEEIDQFNKRIDEIDDLKLNVLDLSKKIAYLEIEKSYASLLSLQNQKFEEEKRIIENNKNLATMKTKVAELNAKKGNVDIALDDINKNLFKIFAGKNRLQLELDDKSNYRVISRKRSIKLKRLSAGEKSVISLCYFFAQLRNNTNAFENYSDSYFIILDDPITSLDFDNKVGIYTFLRSQIEQIIANNSNSRMIVFTHDLEVVYKMNRVLEDIKEATSLGKFFSFRRFDVDKNTHNIDVGKINSYAWNIELIYSYANEDANIVVNADHYIGNILRKTLEAFATFTYRSGISGLTQDERILAKIEDPSVREYYRDRMYRLVLNSDSHTAEIAKTFTDHELFEEFDTSERIETAKDILCILYLLNSQHIRAYLPHDESKIRKIESWIRNPSELNSSN